MLAKPVAGCGAAAGRPPERLPHPLGSGVAITSTDVIRAIAPPIASPAGPYSLVLKDKRPVETMPYRLRKGRRY